MNADPTKLRRPISDFERLWSSLDFEHETLRIPHSGTILPKRAQPDTGERKKAAQLPQLAIADGQSDSPELAIGDTLGEGGMGLVRSAMQLSLQRNVAVKTLKTDQQSPTAVAELLREARITGQLEHPNIIPVYALGKGSDGAPMLVMKRVEGTAWRDVLGQSDHPSLPAGRDALEKHLAVLMQVCQAIQFAHAKGVVHRDLKPDNVMLGQYGEVYVLDWGVALDLNASAAERGQGIAGTPAYMAPEMLANNGLDVSTLTDVYLLGGLLHQLLTGRPPHSGDSLHAVMFAAFQSERQEYPADAPQELVEICRRAMSREPAERQPSAESFRDELSVFLMHRASYQLVAQADARLNALRELLQRDDESITSAMAAEIDSEAYNLFGECRFGYQQALRTWPENAPAAAGLQATLETMVRYEVALGDHRAAAVLVTEMKYVPADLQLELGGLATKMKQESEKLQKLKQLEQDYDLDVGGERRSEFVLVMAIVWTLLPLAMGVLQALKLYSLDYPSYFFSAIFWAGFIGAGLWLGRDELMVNRQNRAFSGALAISVVAMLAHRGFVWLQHASLIQAIANDLLIFFVISGIIAATIDMRLWKTSAVFLGGSLVAILVPSQASFVIAGTDALALYLAWRVWQPAQDSICISKRMRALRKIQRLRALAAVDLGVVCAPLQGQDG